MEGSHVRGRKLEKEGKAGWSFPLPEERGRGGKKKKFWSRGVPFGMSLLS